MGGGFMHACIQFLNVSTLLCNTQAKASGVKNILALRGDPPKGESSFKQIEGGFGCALDLVKFIRYICGMSVMGCRVTGCRVNISC